MMCVNILNNTTFIVLSQYTVTYITVCIYNHIEMSYALI